MSATQVTDNRTVRVRIPEDVLRKVDRVIREASTGLVEVSYQLVFATLAEQIPEEQIVAMLKPTVQALDRERGEAKRLNNRLAQLRFKLKKAEAEGDQERISMLRAEIAELEIKR